MENKLLYFIILASVVSTLSSLVSYPGFNSLIPPYIGYSDVAVFQQKAIDSRLPYIEKEIEYPVITGIFIHVMGFSGPNYYYIVSSIFLTLFAVITSIFLYKIVDALKIDKKKMLYFWILTPTFLFFVIYNWDIIATMFVSMSFYFFIKNKPVQSSIALSLGLSSKIFPVVFLIPLLMKTKKEDRFKVLAIFALTFLLVNSYFIFADFNGWLFTYNFHSTRSANYDSIFGVIQFFIPSLSSSMINIISLGMFGAFYMFLVVLRRNSDFFELCSLSIMLFLFFNKVFSPQFLLWTLVFFVILDFRKRVFYSLEASNMLVFFFVLFWWFAHKEIIELLYLTFFFVIIRHLMLFYIIYRIRKQKPTNRILINNRDHKTKRFQQQQKGPKTLHKIRI